MTQTFLARLWAMVLEPFRPWDAADAALADGAGAVPATDQFALGEAVLASEDPLFVWALYGHW